MGQILGGVVIFAVGAIIETGMVAVLWYALERNTAIVATAAFIYIEFKFNGISNAITFGMDERLKHTERGIWLDTLTTRIGLSSFFKGAPPDPQWREAGNAAVADIKQADASSRLLGAPPTVTGTLAFVWVFWVILTAALVYAGIRLGLWGAREYPINSW